MIRSQSILTKPYIEKVFDEVTNGIGLERFLSDAFPFDEAFFLHTAQVRQPENLLSKMIPTTDGDFKSAVALYEAYKYLSPLQAIDSQLWESLSLTDLFPYMQKRWGLKECKDEKELKSSIQAYVQNAEVPTLAGFLEEIALYTDLEQYNEGDDAVVMMTMHSAKGLEFPIVFLAGMEDGIFPSMQNIAP